MKVTAIIPDHPSVPRHFLAEAVTSLRSQTVPVEQIIILHDYESKGPAWARNAAAQCASETSDWLLLLDADDTISPNFIAECARELQVRGQQDAVVVVPSMAPLTRQIYTDNYLPYCCLVKRSFWIFMGGHKEPSELSRGLCDWDFWIRVYKLGWDPDPVIRISPALFQHRDRADSMSKWSMDQFMNMREDLWRKHGITPCALPS